MKYIKKYFKNKLSKSEKSYCEEILGTQAEVQKFAVLYKNNKDNFKLLAAAILLDYTSTQKYNHEELESFRFGLNAILHFMEECFLEIENEKELAKDKKVQ